MVEMSRKFDKKRRKKNTIVVSVHPPSDVVGGCYNKGCVL